jgi:hexosaminidase
MTNWRPALLFASLGPAALASAASPSGPPLMPRPAEVVTGSGALSLENGLKVAPLAIADARLDRALGRFSGNLARQTGIPGTRAASEGAKPATLTVRVGRAATGFPPIDMDESYVLTVTTEDVTLTAPETWGALHGLETLLDLVEPGPGGLSLPVVTVKDQPRFRWRGLLIDSGRHFIPVDVLKRNLEGMAAVKLNVFHWHLTEDQGFRVESRRFPTLHQKGSDGLFYTQEQVKDLIAYAADRGIRVVPEFDMPGHTTSWFVGHPELATETRPYAIERKWGVMEPAMDPTREEVYRLLDAFLGEMAVLFPDPVLHIGGDEVEGHAWDKSTTVAAFKKAKGLGSNADLQAYFNKRLAQIVTRHGKTMMGWDEILHEDLPKGTIIHSWRGADSLAKAARQGFRGVLSNGFYIDLIQPASEHYAVEPMEKDAASLDAAQAARILGGEATMWSEFVGPETIDSRIWPRTAAIAERLWSPRDVRDTGDMYQRLERASRRLEWLGLEHRTGYQRMLERLAGPEATATEVGALRALADLVEPLKRYERGGTREYTSLTPLNRLVDAVRPESDAARELGTLADRLLADPARQNGREEIRARLEAWQVASGRSGPVIARSSLLADAVPLPGEVAALAGAGLEALAFLAQGRPAPESWFAQRSGLLEKPVKPAHGLEVAFRPAVKRLMEAARGK